MSDLISIITPCHNCSKYIAETLKTVVNQSYTLWELIVINDGSTDNSCEIIKDFIKQDSRILSVNLEKNYGPAYARNQGIKISKGKYIAFLDSDDLWHENKLKIQLDFMKKGELKFSFTAYKKIDEKGNTIGSSVKVPEKLKYQDLLKSCQIGCLTVMYDKSQLGKQFMPEYPKAQDYALWLKILKSGVVAYGLDETLAYYRIRKSSISRNKFKKAFYQWNIYRNQEGIGVLSSIYYMFYYTYFGLKKMF